ncbi:MAG: FadR family transcriptional regulator [Gammaproteobacteria bacterium]|nr:FadR family transcriptional regulator [Gammaproteobacteria bacterium]
MQLRVIKPGRDSEAITIQSSVQISNVELKPGDTLPTQREFANRWKVSHPSVREALQTLKAQCVIERRQEGVTFPEKGKATPRYAPDE